MRRRPTSIAMQSLVTIAALVASLVGHPTPVSCNSAAQWAADQAVVADIGLYGFAPAAYTRLADPMPEIALGPTACQYLSLLMAQPGVGDSPTRFLEGEALLVLLHESEHASGWSGEADAECRAAARYPSVLGQIGVPAKAEQKLAAGASAYHASMPDYYRLGCEAPQFQAPRASFASTCSEQVEARREPEALRAC